jgi:hypothetical protein
MSIKAERLFIRIPTLKLKPAKANHVRDITNGGWFQTQYETTTAHSVLIRRRNGAENDTIQEYFSEIRIESRNEINGNANTRNRQVVKNEDWYN